MDDRPTTELVLRRLRQLGVTLTPVGDRIRCRPASLVPSEQLDYLKQHKGEIFQLLAADIGDGTVRRPAPGLAGVPVVVEGVLGMPLDVFAREGQPIEVRVPGSPATLWFCPDTRHTQLLMRDGVSRGRIWTAAELIDLLSAGGLTPQAVRIVALAKREFDGDVVAVRCREGSIVRPSRQGNGESR